MQVTPTVEKVGNTLNISGKPGFLNAFRAKAIELHGERGVSKAACEGLKLWLAQKGVNYVDETDASRDADRLKKLEALEQIGVPVDELLQRALDEASQPRLLTGS